MTRILTLLRDLCPAPPLPSFGIFTFKPISSRTAARRKLFEQSRDMQRPAPKKIYFEIPKEGAD